MAKVSAPSPSRSMGKTRNSAAMSGGHQLEHLRPDSGQAPSLEARHHQPGVVELDQLLFRERPDAYQTLAE